MYRAVSIIQLYDTPAHPVIWRRKSLYFFVSRQVGYVVHFRTVLIKIMELFLFLFLVIDLHTSHYN